MPLRLAPTVRATLKDKRPLVVNILHNDISLVHFFKWVASNLMQEEQGSIILQYSLNDKTAPFNLRAASNLLKEIEEAQKIVGAKSLFENSRSICADDFCVEESMGQYIHDRYNILACYIHAHRAATLTHPDQQITINFFNHKAEAITIAQLFFNKHSDILPKNVSLKFIDLISNRTAPISIQGSGTVDFNHIWTAKLIAYLTCGDDAMPINKRVEKYRKNKDQLERQYWKDRARLENARLKIIASRDVQKAQIQQAQIQQVNFDLNQLPSCLSNNIFYWTKVLLNADAVQLGGTLDFKALSKKLVCALSLDRSLPVTLFATISKEDFLALREEKARITGAFVTQNSASQYWELQSMDDFVDFINTVFQRTLTPTIPRNRPAFEQPGLDERNLMLPGQLSESTLDGNDGDDDCDHASAAIPYIPLQSNDRQTNIDAMAEATPIAVADESNQSLNGSIGGRTVAGEVYAESSEQGEDNPAAIENIPVTEVVARDESGCCGILSRLFAAKVKTGPNKYAAQTDAALRGGLTG